MSITFHAIKYEEGSVQVLHPHIMGGGGSPGQCNTNIKFLTEYEYEYICNGKFHRIQISNIFVLSKLVEYEYRIYS